MAMKKAPPKPKHQDNAKQVGRKHQNGHSSKGGQKTSPGIATHMLDITNADAAHQPSSWAQPLPEDFYCDNTAKFQYESWQKSPALKRRFAHIIKQDQDLDMVPPKKPKSRKDLLRYANCKLVSNIDERDMRFQVEVEDEAHLNFKITMSKGASFGDILARISLSTLSSIAYAS